MVVDPFDAAREPKPTSDNHDNHDESQESQVKIAELRRTLETMFDRIAAGEDILEQLDRINALHQQVAPAAPKMLCHYLERKSYTKALDLLKTVNSGQ